MNENLDLTKILEGCPKGTKFYSSNYGDVTFFEISPYARERYPIRLHYRSLNINSQPLIVSLTKDGRSVYGYDGECTIFPSKDQRVWSKFVRFWDKSKKERFDPKTLQPYDKVLAKDGFSSKWTCTFFSHMDNDVSFPVYCSGGYFKVCIPYNEETKHLVGTQEDCPEFYKWWEE